jgi:preprotein translocase subunit SecD
MTSIKDYVIDRRILTLLFIVALLGALDAAYGLHFGIEFAGGTMIPLTLQQPANATAMAELISALQQRVSTFGLKQVIVEGIGTSQIQITVPTVSNSNINQTIGIIESQGSFVGVVGGLEAINGSGILKDSIGYGLPTLTNNSYTWSVQFFVTQQGANYFAKQAFGQANQPMYMFLDRPSKAAILLNASILGNSTAGIGASEALAAMQKALTFGNSTIPVITVSNNNYSIANAKSFFLAGARRYKDVFASYNINSSLVAWMQQHNYTVKLESAANMTPSYGKISINQSQVETWPLVGLLSSPVLSPSITNGNISSEYQISGAAPLSLSPARKLAYATNQSKTIASILSGGALPIQVIPGTPGPVPATLGSHFLYISVITGVIAVIFVSLFIMFRYKKLFLVVPILFTTLIELFIIVSFIGLVGTIDLAAVAGMIAVVGTGVDAQIIITDEVLAAHGEHTSAHTLLGNAFYIVYADAALLVIAMMPLFFSTSLVSVIGFSESTIIGAMLGIFVTRPAYGAIISKRYK